MVHATLRRAFRVTESTREKPKSMSNPWDGIVVALALALSPSAHVRDGQPNSQGAFYSPDIVSKCIEMRPDGA